MSAHENPLQEDCLLEIGCEELPAREQLPIRDAAIEQMTRLLKEAGLSFGQITAYVTPRRLALWIQNLALHSQPRESIRRGPPLERARDAAGNITPAAEGFARSCGVAFTDLSTLDTEKGPVLAWREVEAARSSHSLLPDIASQTIAALPLRKRMHWGTRDDSFIRPVRWLLLRQGQQVLDWQAFGLQAGGQSFGHRVHHPEAIRIHQPADYAAALLDGHVMADFDARRAHISHKISAIAEDLRASPILPAALLDEITGLNEWPVILIGSFAEDYLRIPEEALITVMMQHQRYVPLRDGNGRLISQYLFAANIHSQDAQMVIHGNNRVLRARLADAAFFWDQDRQKSLAARLPELQNVLFQEGLGSIYDKTLRLQKVARSLSSRCNVKADDLERAAALCKSDLLSGVVGEFPELQGIMGGHYARHDGENTEVVAAIAQHYLPNGRDDDTPQSPAGQCLAIADKLDTLCGFFAIGKIPTGDRDPFALRRAALGVLRIILDAELDLPLDKAVTLTLEALGHGIVKDPTAIGTAVLDFFQDRMRVYFREESFRTDQINAVLSRQPHQVLDARKRLEALSRFLTEHQAAEALAALIKRVNNLLRKENVEVQHDPDPQLFEDPAEHRLWEHWQVMAGPVHTHLQNAQYASALDLLAGLRPTVDTFFDKVMVLAENPEIRQNRLALLTRLQDAFLRIADFTQLQGS
ncbi:glycine--tRNA ligase subunit beta [Acidithiobacillus thiooxidans]|uniref:glycine--tRNA ligase subunit beta n=1 Tax=Acidithiobacillus thiooxidans TaxID=930 RepID=UPI001C06F16E|nr:glycine--tRNA ligase subunit beta [Acidithiobacillus thiooxidans]MBU2843704.1 glycine--tRNA ligase subunit beta [Acidithiobacillus thiooxidans]